MKELTTKVTIFSAVVTCPSSKVNTHFMSKSLTVWLSIHTWWWSGWYFSYLTENMYSLVMFCAHYTLRGFLLLPRLDITVKLLYLHVSKCGVIYHTKDYIYTDIYI